jgi:predicted GNAT family acetyltransferase
MTYSRAGEGLIIIDHTEVPAALRGRKVGERMVRQAVEDARLERVAVIPLSSTRQRTGSDRLL